MIIKSVRLHPFGKTADHTHELAGPIAVVLGPNEHGKSTLRQAIHHALFTTTQLTTKQAEKAVGRWFPRPGGDHAAVTVVFEHEGVEWRLFKRWGADHRSALTGGGATIADESAVQRRIGEMLGHNEATARLVLSTGQAELARTLEAIKAAGQDDLRPVGDVMSAAAGAAGDVGPEKLRAQLEGLIREHFSRWDRHRQAPELDKGKERGIQNPWINGKGKILDAWYGWQRQREELQALEDAERSLDAVTTELSALQAEMAQDTAFIAGGRALRDGLNERERVEAALTPLRAEAEAMVEANREWPRALEAIAASETRLCELAETIDKLEAEQEAARRRDAARQTQEQFAAIGKAREAWETAEAEAAKTARPAAAAVAELVGVSERIKDARNRLDAQKLAYTIESSTPIAATVEAGFEPERRLPIDGAAVAGEARSRVRIRAGDVTITVASGEEDVQALVDALRGDERREEALLRACAAASLGDAQAAVKLHDGLVQAARRAKDAYEARLQGKTLEEWQTAVDAIAALPLSRASEQIAAELKQARGRVTAETSAQAVHKNNDRKWSEKYQAPDALLDLLVEKRTAIKSREKSLEGLPAVPEGFASTRVFLEELGRRERANDGRTSRIMELTAEQQRLKDAVGDRRTAEMEEDVAAAQRSFERVCQEGRDYERILAVLEEIVQEGEADPAQIFAEKVTGYFREVTGGADALVFDGDVPGEVDRGGVVLPPGYLSQGGTTALALAMRLALAEVHLGGGRGFIVLDDPFVDLDATRRGRAVGLVRRFAERHQVVFLTCHEAHADDFRGPAGAAS